LLILLHILFSVTIALCLANVLKAEKRKIIHDGVEMTLTVEGDNLIIAYTEPPPALREIGVTSGQVLVSGTWTKRDPGALVGHAYMFSPSCPGTAIQYDVRGVVDANGSLVIIGPTPNLKPDNCEVTGLSWSDAAVMEFASSTSERKIAEKKKRFQEEKSKPKPKPKPKPRPRIERPAQPYPYQYPQYQYPQPPPRRW